MSKTKKEQAFLRLVRDLEILTPEQISQISEQQRADAKNGILKSLAQLALENHFVSEDELDRIETDLWIEGLPDRLDDYEILRLIGRGGMAAVFEARDVSVGKVVALKVLLPQFAGSTAYLARFHREALMAAKLTHPNTVHVFRAGSHEGAHFLVMEYVEGRPVSALLREHGPMEEGHALDIALAVARSLQEAHQLGIVHRDVKPSNILISKWGVVKLTDFGIAKQISDIGDERLQRSLTFGIVGTPQYMSPEQVRGAKDIDARTDIYSLGASLYHMLAGAPPYEAHTPQETMYRVTSAEAEDLRTRRPGLSRDTGDLVCRMMARAPEQRFESCEALAVEIEAVRARVAPVAPPPPASAVSRDEEPPPTPSGPVLTRKSPPEETFTIAEPVSVGRVLLTAAAVVLIGTALFFGVPRLRGCRAETPPAAAGAR